MPFYDCIKPIIVWFDILSCMSALELVCHKLCAHIKGITALLENWNITSERWGISLATKEIHEWVPTSKTWFWKVGERCQEMKILYETEGTLMDHDLYIFVLILINCLSIDSLFCCKDLQ